MVHTACEDQDILQENLYNSNNNLLRRVGKNLTASATLGTIATFT